MAVDRPGLLLNFARTKRLGRRRFDAVGGMLTLAVHALLVAAFLATGAYPIAGVPDEKAIDVAIVPPESRLTEAQPHLQPKFVRVNEAVVIAPIIEIAPNMVEAKAAPSSRSLEVAGGPSEKEKSDYVGQLHRHLQSFIRFPGVAGRVTLQFFVDKDGKVHALAVAKSSGKRDVDEAALALVARAEPLPPVPASLRVDMFGALVPVVYEFTSTASRRPDRP